MVDASDFKRSVDELRYRRNVLEALLVSSISQESSWFPTIEQFVLSELVNATIEYVGGNAGQIIYQRFLHDEEEFEKHIYNYFKSEMERCSGEKKLDPCVNRAIDKLCEYYPVTPPEPFLPYNNVELYIHFIGGVFGEGICPVITESSFSLPYETVERFKRDLFPKLSESEKRDIIGIGKIMRKYIDSDLEFIKERYYW